MDVSLPELIQVLTELEETTTKLNGLRIPHFEGRRKLTLWERVQAYSRIRHDVFGQPAENTIVDESEAGEPVNESDMALLFADCDVPEPIITQASIEHELKLTRDQEVAFDKLQTWIATGYVADPYFVLRGFAGTGKTYLMQLLTKIDRTFYFTSPTNKATKELSRSVGVAAKTTYSLLGLRMEHDEEEMVLVAGDKPVYIPRGAIIVVDEASTTNKLLVKAIDEVVQRCKCLVLYVGDPAQLPPVGETASRAWKVTLRDAHRAMLKQVMRYDNQLLALSLKLRRCIRNKDYTSPIESDYSKTEGIRVWPSQTKMLHHLFKTVTGPADFATMRIIAWRNKTVEHYNSLVREHFGFRDTYCVTDRLMLVDPIEQDGTIIAHTDDEFSVVEVNDSMIVVDEVEIPVYQLVVEGDVNLVLNVAKDSTKVDRALARLSRQARAAKGLDRKALWIEFWDLKKKFHTVRYGYAITAHRAQGSTYDIVYLDQVDVLANTRKSDAFRCLYVIATRPRKWLYTF